MVRRFGASGVLAAMLLASAAQAGRSKVVTVTAYCLGPCRTCATKGRTTTGTRARRGVAVSRLASRRAFPLGCRVRIPGYGVSRVDDVGGGVKSGQIDIRLPHPQAVQWGRRKVKVKVLK